MTSAYDFHIHTLLGEAVDLKDYAGQVTLVVNVASQCGFTPQYAGLQALHDQFHARGFSVLAFPCNQFGAQEPGNAEEIAQFCERQYGVTFPVFEKIDVNGAKAHPLYQFLVKQKRGVLGTEAIKWNFTKFLIDRHGQVLKRYAPTTKPEAIGKDVASTLDSAAPQL
ncbi:MAG: glutathione peroxidase [Burkholderiales bacterium]